MLPYNAEGAPCNVVEIFTKVGDQLFALLCLQQLFRFDNVLGDSGLQGIKIRKCSFHAKKMK